MSVITFDALQYTDELIKVGVPEAQAKKQVHILQSAVDRITQSQNLTTKSDLANLEVRLIKWMVASQVSTVVILATLFRLFS